MTSNRDIICYLNFYYIRDIDKEKRELLININNYKSIIFYIEIYRK